MRSLVAAAAFTWLLGLAACPDSESPASNFCPTPWAIGPLTTAGVCGLGEMCVPSADAVCSGNNCCHIFCDLTICGEGIAQIAISPDDIPDGGAPGCGCDPGIIDAGECVCADGGAPCYRSSCLCVCGE